MKISKTIIIIICTFTFFSCSKKTEQDKTVTIQDSETITQSTDEKVDFDLTKMSSTIMYSEVFNMMIEPERYENKRLKIKGLFVSYPIENNNPVYAVIVPDATACCQQGIEFKYDLPDSLPEEGSEITVTGIFRITMSSEDIMYTYLETEKIQF